MIHHAPPPATTNPSTDAQWEEDTQRLARAIDHTKLTFAPDEDPISRIQTLCQEAKTFGFYAVCVRPEHVRLAKTCLSDSPIKVATVIGFPLKKVELEAEQVQPSIGCIVTEEASKPAPSSHPHDSSLPSLTIAESNTSTPLSMAPLQAIAHQSCTYKVSEIQQALLDGADELDIVIPVVLLKADIATGSTMTLEELRTLQAAAQDKPTKVILETDLLTPDERVQAVHWCADAGIQMIKTSTGMLIGGQGATLEIVQHLAQIRDTLRQTSPHRLPLGIKASGGIASRSQALCLLHAGATRLGTSAGLSLMGTETQKTAGQFNIY